MDFLEKIEKQLTKMTETEKDKWILSQAKLFSESQQEGILLSLSGEKKIIDMPMYDEINKFCERVENGEIYFEYETHYYEFDDDGRYMDDWKIWHNDVFGAIPFLDRVFAGCHDLMRLEEYEDVVNILDRVCMLEFSVVKAEDSEDEPEEETFSLSDADKEDMFSIKLCDVGAEWIRAVAQLTNGQDKRSRIQKLLGMFEHPVCRKVKTRILLKEGISQEMFIEMAKILEGEIADLEALKEDITRKGIYYRERYKVQSKIDRKMEMLSDIRVKCLNTLSGDSGQKESNLAACWKQILEGIKWLSYEIIDDQPEIETIQKICEALIRSEKLEQEDWQVRKNVLTDIIQNEFYDYYSCGDEMNELAEKLCTNKEEYLAYADIMDASGRYREKAAYLYYKHGKDDKYISYLEENLERRGKEYSALITYYQEHGRQEEACRVAELGLKCCREDLTDFFICLLLEAQKIGDQKKFQKLYASAKRRKHVDVEKIKKALEQSD